MNKIILLCLVYDKIAEKLENISSTLYETLHNPVFQIFEITSCQKNTAALVTAKIHYTVAIY